VGGGHRSGAKRREKNFFGRAPPLFGCKSTIVWLRALVSTVWSLLFFCSQCSPPRGQPFVKVGARAPVPHGVGATDNDVIFLWYSLPHEKSRHIATHRGLVYYEVKYMALAD